MQLFKITKQNWRHFFSWGLVELGQLITHQVTGKAPRTERVLEHVKRVARRGNPAAVLAAMDTFARNEQFLMNVGEVKGALLDEVILGARHGRVLELGSYCGYSAVVIARRLEGEGHLTCIEKQPRLAEIAREIVDHAGLSSRVDVRVGAAGEVIPTLRGTFDVIFIDHWKDAYHPDLLLLERHGLLRPGTIVVADNTGIFSSSLGGYLDHVRRSGKYESRELAAPMEYQDRIPDAVEISIFHGAS